MFDMNNKELVKKIIDQRDDDEYVIPLYVKIYNEKFSILELDNITDISPSSFKVGFGSSSSIFTKNSFISKYAMDFETINVFKVFDNDNNVDVLYNIFETGFVTENSDMHIQINDYVQMLMDRISDSVSIKRKKMLEDLDNENS